MTLLEAPEAPSRLPSSSLSADSVARLVSAATVEATFAGRFTAELALPLVLAAVLGEAARPAAWLLLTLPTDKMTPIGTATAPLIGREAKNLRRNGRITTRRRRPVVAPDRPGPRAASLRRSQTSPATGRSSTA